MQGSIFIEDINSGSVSVQPFRPNDPEHATWLGAVTWRENHGHITMQITIDDPNWEEKVQSLINDLTQLRDQLKQKEDL